MTELGDLGYYEIVFPKLGIDITVKSVAFTIFGMQITWYGLIITFGMLLAMIYGFSQMKRYGIDSIGIALPVTGKACSTSGAADLPFTAVSSAHYWWADWWQSSGR